MNTNPIESKMKVLVVDDNLMNQKMVGFMLMDWSLDFDVCGNGKLAIEKLKTDHYHLILMDIQMPEMNGYETTEYIRQQLKLTTPVIAMTAQSLSGKREKCLRSGMTDYISKPIVEIDLYNLISKYIIDDKKDVAPKVTNFNYLEELSKGNAQFVKEMTAIFLAENPVKLKEMEQAMQESDFERIRTLSHYIISSIPFVGLDHIIGKELATIEKLATENTGMETIRTLFEKVKMVCEKAFLELNK